MHAGVEVRRNHPGFDASVAPYQPRVPGLGRRVGELRDLVDHDAQPSRIVSRGSVGLDDPGSLAGLTGRTAASPSR